MVWKKAGRRYHRWSVGTRTLRRNTSETRKRTAVNESQSRDVGFFETVALRTVAVPTAAYTTPRRSGAA